MREHFLLPQLGEIRFVHELPLVELCNGLVAGALARFTPLWEALAPQEQARLVGLLVQRVDYDGAKHRVSVTLHPKGLVRLAEELASKTKENKG